MSSYSDFVKADAGPMPSIDEMREAFVEALYRERGPQIILVRNAEEAEALRERFKKG